MVSSDTIDYAVNNGLIISYPGSGPQGGTQTLTSAYNGEGTFIGYSMTSGSTTADPGWENTTGSGTITLTNLPHSSSLYVISLFSVVSSGSGGNGGGSTQITITYGNTTIVTSAEAGEWTLETAGTYATGDIVVTVSGATGGASTIELISFSIGDTTYQAEEGMTWAEWCDSEYNTRGCYIGTTSNSINGSSNYIIGSETTHYLSTNGQSTGTVYSTDEVVEGTSYSFANEPTF